jgi:hypothetical protein
MTTLPSSPDVQVLVDQLREVRARKWAVDVLAGVLATFCLVCAAIILVGAVAGYWPGQPPVWLRIGLLGAGASVLAASVVVLVLARAVRRINDAQAARFVEQRIPEVRNDLINSLLLAREADDAPLVRSAIGEAVRNCRGIDLGPSVSTRSLRWWAVAAGAALLALGSFALLDGRHLRRGLLAVLEPARYVPSVNRLALRDLSPGDATVFFGEAVTISATLDEAPVGDVDGEVLFAGQADPEAMLATLAGRRYVLPRREATETFRYAVRIGESRWPIDRPWYTVTVIRRIEVLGLDLLYRYPDYTGRPEETVEDAQGPIEAPVGTEVTVRLRLADAVGRVTLERSGVEPVLMIPTGGKASYQASFPVVADGGYRIVLADAGGRVIQQVPASDAAPRADAHSQAGRDLLNGSFPIRALPDRAPSVRFASPGRDVQAGAGTSVPLRLRVSDDVGLSRVAVLVGVDGEGFDELANWDAEALVSSGGQEAVLDHALSLAEFTDGQTLVYYAVATDNRRLGSLGGPQRAESGRYRIVVQDAARIEQAKALRRDKLRGVLMRILERQLAQRVNAGLALRRYARLGPIRRTGGQIQAGQRAIRAELVDLVEGFEFDPETLAVRQACALLAGNEARTAISQAEVLAHLPDLDDRNEACGLLIDSQEAIIETLQSLLAFLPEMAKTPQQREKARGGDLPAGSAERIRKLAETLQQFAEEQKKVIEASKRLAKSPVDDFTRQEEIKKLQAVQDKWEKFLNEAFTDLSKLAEQDFSNPSMLKELIRVKSDVTMARDALKKQAVEIATAAEESGTENAESLTANIEKWLPDEPDREKWSMESLPEGDENFEMPELPTELEDLVGDLLEEEEDLFDEMDDVASKSATSGDKGIGWDAMDGPIDSMNAQGVTGNRLPNTDEKGGRSGEGRQGKSTGEYVQDSAEGKGGRRTPTRLTPEPFQKGQVDDESTDPAGGATGGGKLSGAGGEGLEGPVGPDVQRKMQRLAGRQAALVNRAERIEAAHGASDYSAFALREAIVLMNRVRRDLEAGNYRNALRARRRTLSALRQSKLMLAGGIDVDRDTSPPMPEYVRDEIADAMTGKLPERYREVLGEYYQRLNEP